MCSTIELQMGSRKHAQTLRDAYCIILAEIKAKPASTLQEFMKKIQESQSIDHDYDELIYEKVRELLPWIYYESIEDIARVRDNHEESSYRSTIQAIIYYTEYISSIDSCIIETTINNEQIRRVEKEKEKYLIYGHEK
jgi:hypothetical protein